MKSPTLAIRPELRKAYFSGKLDDFLNKCLAQGVEPQEYATIEIELENLKEEADKLKKSFSKFSKVDEFKPPTVEDLMGLTPDKKEKLKEWEKEKESDYNQARILIDRARQATHESRVPAQDWLTWGLELATLQYSLDQYRVWKDQLYRGKLTNIIDTYGLSRAEAEERAKLTPEYRAYKEAVLFREMTEETIMILKKWAGLYQ